MSPGPRSAAWPVWTGLAVLLTGLGLVELVVQLEPTPARLLGTLLTTAPIALAAWRPYAALAVLFGVQLLDAALRRSDDFVVAALLAMMVSLFAVAVTRPARQALPGLVAGLVLANVGIALDPSTVAGDHLFAAILLTGPWLAGVAVHHWRRQAIELERVGQELRAAQDDRLQLGLTLERMRVARDLHDSTAQALNAVIVHAEAAEEALTRDPDGVAVALRRIQQVGRMALADTRQVVEALRGDGGDGEPRLAHLDRLVATFADTGLEVDCRVEEADAPLPAAVEAAAYRIVQEGLTNVLKHSTARRAAVTVEQTARELLVTVCDPGPARTPPTSPGHGLVGMRERASLVGGTLEVDRGSGFTVTAVLPLGEPA